MLNIGPAELAVIVVFALLILGPKGLPDFARGIGKFMREFRRQTDEVRGVVEREFYKMDEDEKRAALPAVAPEAAVSRAHVEPLAPPEILPPPPGTAPVDTLHRAPEGSAAL